MTIFYFILASIKTKIWLTKKDMQRNAAKLNVILNQLHKYAAIDIYILHISTFHNFPSALFQIIKKNF